MDGKYGGSWAKGFASTFNPAAGINLGLQWKERKEAQKKIDDAVKQLKQDSLTLAAKFDAARVDGSITQQEFSDALAWALPLGDEITGRVQKLYGNYRQYTKEQIDNELGEIDAFYKLSADLDFTNVEEMRSFGSNLTQEKAKTKWDLIIKSIESRGKTTQPELFTTAGGVREKYPEAGVKYTEQGYVPTFAEPAETKEPSAADKKYNWAIEHHALPEGSPGKISDEQLFKFMGVDVSDPVKRNTIQQRLDEMDKLGATTEEKKNYLLGGGGGEEKERATSLPQLESYRTQILEADTLEEAQRKYDSYAKEYNEEDLKINLPKDWTDVKQGDLMDLTSVLNEITSGTPENRNIKGNKEFTFEINGTVTTKTGEEWYKAVYESYIALLKLLEKQGVDTSQYKKLKPLSEIKKIKFGGFVGKGVEAGDLISIYY